MEPWTGRHPFPLPVLLWIVGNELTALCTYCPKQLSVRVCFLFISNVQVGQDLYALDMSSVLCSAVLHRVVDA